MTFDEIMTALPDLTDKQRQTLLMQLLGGQRIRKADKPENYDMVVYNLRQSCAITTMHFYRAAYTLSKHDDPQVSRTLSILEAAAYNLGKTAELLNRLGCE